MPCFILNQIITKVRVEPCGSQISNLAYCIMQSARLDYPGKYDYRVVFCKDFWLYLIIIRHIAIGNITVNISVNITAKAISALPAADNFMTCPASNIAISADTYIKLATIIVTKTSRPILMAFIMFNFSLRTLAVRLKSKNI